jgi:molecular chaperone DnaK (HSP70)
VNRKIDIWPVWSEFVDRDILLPGIDISGEVRDKILNKNNTLGIKLSDTKELSKDALQKIKQKQYLSRVTGKKQS